MKMPQRGTRKWRRLWYSGAIPKDTVFYADLADRLEAAKQQDAYYFGLDDADAVRRGRRLARWSIGFVDMCAFVASELRLNDRQYDIFTARLFGKTAREVNDAFRERRPVAGFADQTQEQSPRAAVAR